MRRRHEPLRATEDQRAACRNQQVVEPLGYGLDRPSCRLHLTADERQLLAQQHEQLEAAESSRWDARPAAYHSRPAPAAPLTSSDDLRDWQCGRCAICGCHNRDDRLVLDHDHASGLVRGWLCQGCNIAGAGLRPQTCN
jgi:hypothetical protein